jgi:epoxyqueuosine reductase
LVEPRVLDARRCLSYLTIELRRAIPEELRANLGTHVYGCDVCQEVCPWNQAAPSSGDPAWLPHEGLDRPRLTDLWRRGDADLERLVQGSAMTRAKTTGLRRNIAVALGNSRDASTRMALAEVPQDGGSPSLNDQVVRAHVEWARRRGPEGPRHT